MVKKDTIEIAIYRPDFKRAPSGLKALLLFVATQGARPIRDDPIDANKAEGPRVLLPRYKDGTHPSLGIGKDSPKSHRGE